MGNSLSFELNCFPLRHLFLDAFKLCCLWVKSLSRVWLSVTPWTVAYQASPSMGFSRQKYWSGFFSGINFFGFIWFWKFLTSQFCRLMSFAKFWKFSVRVYLKVLQVCPLSPILPELSWQKLYVFFWWSPTGPWGSLHFFFLSPLSLCLVILHTP